MRSQGSKFVPKMLRELPDCPVCSSHNTVGVVSTLVERTSKNGNIWYACSKAYFCSNCLTEWNKSGINEPMYA